MIAGVPQQTEELVRYARQQGYARDELIRLSQSLTSG